MSNDNYLEIQIKRLSGHEDLPLPEYRTEGAAGMDLYAAIVKDVVIESGKTMIIPCGIAIAVPFGFEAQIRPRSGLAYNYNLSILNSPGTIDSDFRGEIKVLVVNHGEKSFSVTRGMRIAQMVILPVSRVKWREVNELPQTSRGECGYGHTGDD